MYCKNHVLMSEVLDGKKLVYSIQFIITHDVERILNSEKNTLCTTKKLDSRTSGYNEYNMKYYKMCTLYYYRAYCC